jgi:predicted PurR-regulated permease PerM
VLLVVGLLIGVPAIVKPLTTAILFDGSLAIAAWPLRQALIHRGLGHGPAAVLLLLLSLVLGFAALLLAISQIGGPTACANLGWGRPGGCSHRIIRPGELS